MSFQSFQLAPEILQAIQELGHTQPTPIQQQAIPVILNGTDVMALAQTGTGKTAAFTLPLLQLLNSKQDHTAQSRQVRALILTPTRELAAQVGESVRNYGRNLTLRSEIVFGGVNITPQIRKLQRGTDIIIATPGRLLDLVNQRVVNLSHVEILVLDEADRMLDMGFIHDVKKIFALLPKKRQNMLFSATLSTEIQTLANTILRNHKLIEVASRNVSTELVTQLVYQVDQKRKRELLSYLIGFNNWQQVLVFTRTKHNANKLCAQLIEDGLTAAAIHGNKSQGARTRALEEFKSGKIRILVATDIAARGLDIEQLPYVINYELPNIAEDYVHRIGRTGRAGKSGNAISLVCSSEAEYLRDIEKFTKKTIAKKILPGYEPDQTIQVTTTRRPHHNRARTTSRPGNTNSATRNARPGNTSGEYRNARPGNNSSEYRSARSGNNSSEYRSARSSNTSGEYRNARPSNASGEHRSARSGSTSGEYRHARSGKTSVEYKNARPGSTSGENRSAPPRRKLPAANHNKGNVRSYS